MKTVVVSVLAVMVLAGSALAAIPSTTAYLLATQPMITGKVASVNDHAMVVDTEQGGRVTLAVDSKTMVPTDLAPGMVMRVEFKAMPDGHYYARRVIPIRDGMDMGRELAYRRTSGHATTQYASHEGAADDGEDNDLPQTAGVQPLIALLGLLALASAGVLAVSRRLRSV
jgi:hypothetical protein